MAFQMFVLLLIAVFAGQKLDTKLQLSQPLFTIVFMLISMIGYLLKIYIDVTQNKL